MDMTSATVASNDFLAVLKKQRALAHQSIENPSGGIIGLSADEQLGSLPISNSDALDDALQQIKAICNSGATTTADQAQNEITTITNTYMNSARDDNASAAFRQQMEQSKARALNNAKSAIDKAYDKAVDLGRNMTPSEQNALVSFMSDVVQKGISSIINEIADFIVNAIRTLVTWIKDAFDSIKQVFEKINAFIKNIF
jgi:alanyl-tRNA synthetase